MKTPKKIPFKDMILFGQYSHKPTIKQEPQKVQNDQKPTESTEVLLVINVDVGKLQETKIFYHKDDNPEKLAEDFCKLHNLNHNIKDILSRNIEEKVEVFKRKEINIRPLVKGKEEEKIGNRLFSYGAGICQSVKKMNYMKEKQIGYNLP